MNATDQLAVTRLEDYRPPDYEICSTDLRFEIGDGETVVTNRMRLERRGSSDDLVLDGQELDLLSVSVDDRELGSNEYRLDSDSLTLIGLADECQVTVVTKIRPEQNTALEGLYKSSGMYCTQCEAEGFRKITYYQDRPDVLSVFTTTIIADSRYPVLLSNGNLTANERLDDGRNKVTWSDPFPKPSYLFALVVGDLALLEDIFVTASGRSVTLKIYSEPHNIDQCEYAMEVLKRSMRWDEEAFGREYDLDTFMIVAVDDFNMGAMENKGLNIFNTSCVLATPDTATDQSYLRVEAVVAHEYFHNWSGNRVTCRDWFQLSLKEGFTVFRDAEFSGDMNSRTVKRIGDVNLLRSVQFAEDAGPLAHPVRPASYIEISNFYTPTVYQKGAEVVRMVHTIVGAAAFRRGSDLYFERYDGQAVTTEDFLAAMTEASGADLSQFQRWYDQAGTPSLHVTSQTADGTLTLSVTQSCPATPGQPEKAPFHIPIGIGLLDDQGVSLVDSTLSWESESELEIRGDTALLHLKSEVAQIRFADLPEQVEVSFLRGFTAPVKVDFARSNDSLSFLATRDSDGFSAWDALQTMLVGEIEQLGVSATVTEGVVDLYEALLDQALADTSATAEENFLLAAKLAIPDENYLFEQVDQVDVDQICSARDRLRNSLGCRLAGKWRTLLEANDLESAYAPDSLSMSRRALRNCALGYLVEDLDSETLSALLKGLYEKADNLTDRRAILISAINIESDSELSRELLRDFYDRWQDQALVINQWFAVQSTGRYCNSKTLEMLLEHPAFTLENPNKVRSVLSLFATHNPRNFHAIDGGGYELIGDKVIELNGINPQMAASLAKPLTRWRRYVGERRLLMRNTLGRISTVDELSSDVYEIVTKSLI